MSRAFFAWGVLMGAIGLIGVLFFGFADVEPPALLLGTSGVFFAIALFLALTRFGNNDPGAPHATPDISPPVLLLALAITAVLLGGVVGWWLSLIGAGLALFAIGGLIREAVGQRRLLRRALHEHGGGFGDPEVRP
jgi:hypothetical protein